jgi:hypothetical protein
MEGFKWAKAKLEKNSGWFHTQEITGIPKIIGKIKFA